MSPHERTPSRPRILCVDDDERLLAGLELRLRRGFDVVTAPSAAIALSRLDLGAPFAAVITDMRMPQVDGATFLSAIRRVSPETMRILLTGQADLASAIAAVNEGEVFRILLKPIEAPALIATLDEAVARHREIIAERQVIEALLHGTIDLLSLSLSVMSPQRAVHAARIRSLVTDIASVVCPRQLWTAELCAEVVELALASIPDDTVARWRHRAPLSESERAALAASIRNTEAIVRRMPHTEPIWEGLKALATTIEHDTKHAVSIAAAMPVRVMHLALVFDALVQDGVTAADALAQLAASAHPDDAPLMAALASSPTHLAPGCSRGPLWRMRPGQRIMFDVRNSHGVLLLPKGHVVTDETLSMLDLVDEGTRHLEVVTRNVPGANANANAA